MVDLDSLRLGWCWEYLLLHLEDYEVLKQLAKKCPPPNSNLVVKKMLLLRSLENVLSSDGIVPAVVEKLVGIARLASSLQRKTTSSGKSFDENEKARVSPAPSAKLVVDVMTEIAVGIVRNRKDVRDDGKFYSCVSSLWVKADEYFASAEWLEDASSPHSGLRIMHTRRDEIIEASKDIDSLPSFARKFPAAAVEESLKSFMHEAWMKLGQSKLQAIEEDVVNGHVDLPGWDISDTWQPTEADVAATKEAVAAAAVTAAGRSRHVRFARKENADLAADFDYLTDDDDAGDYEPLSDGNQQQQQQSERPSSEEAKAAIQRLRESREKLKSVCTDPLPEVLAMLREGRSEVQEQEVGGERGGEGEEDDVDVVEVRQEGGEGKREKEEDRQAAGEKRGFEGESGSTRRRRVKQRASREGFEEEDEEAVALEEEGERENGGRGEGGEVGGQGAEREGDRKGKVGRQVEGERGMGREREGERPGAMAGRPMRPRFMDRQPAAKTLEVGQLGPSYWVDDFKWERRVGG